ncbi:CotH kinase family protein [Candidatus Saccharibacteria bacterium]|nr:CotH kinase family protein [Candidatus Saccharibacteria bacterium]
MDDCGYMSFSKWFLLVFSLNKREEPTEIVRAMPEMRLVLNEVTLDEINNGSKNTKYTNNKMTLIDGDYEYGFDNVEIKGRGNASWLMDKKSYRIKFPEKVDLFGLGKLRKWGLISNNVDDSLMRNDLGQFIASLLYENYPIRGDFVKFVVDEKNLGLYYMTKLVSIGKNMIDLRDPSGILVELDNAYCVEKEPYRLSEIMSDCIAVDDAIIKEDVREIFSVFMGDYSGFERAIRLGDYEATMEKADMESFAKYYLLSEISSNPDAYVTSWYLYKDGDGDKIHSKIGWDFDGAFGNREWWGYDEEIYSPVGLMARMRYSVGGWELMGNDVDRCKLLDDTLISPVMCYMVDMPEFRDLVVKIYREKLMGRREEIISHIRNVADYIRDEAIADSELWGKGNCDEEVEYLVWWVDKRFDYLDEIFGGGWPKPVEL